MTLLLLMIGAVAMVRSFGTTSALSGNLAFRRDLSNEGERGIAAAIALMKTGALSTPWSRISNAPAYNYSATRLPTNSDGIPVMLVNDTIFGYSGVTGADIEDSVLGIKVRYVVDRLCTTAGDFNEATCVTGAGAQDRGGSPTEKPSGQVYPLYRISVRVTGPRNTQAYFQTTVASY
ncbi:MAG TPA: hypothetical protein VFP68_08295 [Burkholderiaceae bacterium]|nr:hypothetical protein [Burkholderiaceae bacterium]